MKSFEVGIPTYDRPELIQRATLAYLDRSGIPEERITIFIAPEQVHLYRDLPERWQRRIVQSVLGLAKSKQWAEWKHYKEGTNLVWLNDDIFSIRQRITSKNTIESPLGEIATEGFDGMSKVKAWLWGIYAVLNPFYMKPITRYGLCYIVGCAYGTRTRRKKALYPIHGDAKEDYERCLRFYQNDGRLFRMDSYAPKTIYYNSPVIFPNVETIERNIQALEKLWPRLVKRNRSKKSKFPEILISDPSQRGIMAGC
jgi:hypothetical protein